MATFTRRGFLKTTAGIAVGAALANAGGLTLPEAAAAESSIIPEKDAKLRVLRWKRFVQGDEDQWLRNTTKFSKKTGVEIRVDSEQWEDLRAKAAVVANEDRGPDIILGWYDDPQLYPHKLVDVSDVANYLGRKYGGWYDIFRKYGTRDGAWIALPLGVVPGSLVYRESMIKAAGFDSIPKDTENFLKLCRALKANNTPPGFSYGHAVGDANSFCHWLLWSHGGKLVDNNNNVVINTKEVIDAVEYAKDLYSSFIPGTLSWDDSANNRFFLDGQISLTWNGASIYYAAKTSNDPGMQAIAADIQHANLPIGPVGKPAEFTTLTQMMLFKHCKYPNAGKAYMRFMMEQEQFDPWLQASLGYITQPFKSNESHPLWASDPKLLVYRDAVKRMRDHGYSGRLGYASAAVMAEYVVVDMFADAASGAKTAQAAVERAEKRALRYYKV
jgi:multiple sugar transport system substrate-binding protein